MFFPQLGGPPWHYGGGGGAEEDRLRRLQRFRGLVLGQPGCRGSGLVDVVSREGLGDTGLCDSAGALHSHQEAH